ncbi:hypothetical protein A1F96_07009 [Pyrenophora tritici-repentis]|uniref:Uncharacterized protein n=1 Tax=Pyrenophora tritici-repentis TaxID=45151 RepID=A0A2W1FXX2_9PLEO|nr:hypothetical protein PtrM4_140800 [Pyrenophora tritici-repentis]KAI0576557.1 hypothetical protein Alg215_07422 [Pyrenophora tritici-repentis]PZD27132.1 hypothetical protein A1F96_07009 [Pyrenophora tritici-repentis]
MLKHAKQAELRESMRALKQMYLSRQYTQCVQYAEQLLKEVDEETHPVHLAYLNFYAALSHDTLARQSTLKNRFKELNAAEKHYMAAIEALSPPSACSSPPSSDDEPPSTPDSATLPDERIWQRQSYNFNNTLSVYSTNTYRTSMSSITSYVWELEQDPDSVLNHYSFPTPPPKERDLRRDSRRDSRGDLGAIYKRYSRHMKTEGHLSASVRNSQALPKPAPRQPARLPPSTPSFIVMVKGHLASVRGLKDNTVIRGVRFANDSPTPSPKTTNFRFRDSASVDRETLWQRRKKVPVRKRFDAESCQQLCRDALAEIS